MIHLPLPIDNELIRASPSQKVLLLGLLGMVQAYKMKILFNEPIHLKPI